MAADRAIRTWRVGQVGMKGVRAPDPTGRIKINGEWFQSDRMIGLDYVFFYDDDEPGTVAIWTVEWRPKKGSSLNGMVALTGKDLGRAHAERA